MNRGLKRPSGSDLLSILTSGSVLAFLQIFNAGLAFGVQLAMARWMAISDYGLFALGWAVATLAAILAALGLPQASLRFVPEYTAGSDDRRLAGFISWSRVIVVAAGTAIAVVGVIAIELIRTLGAGSRHLYWYAALGLVPLLALSNLHVRQSHAFGWPIRAYLPQVLLTQSGLLIAAGLAVVFGVNITASWALTTLLVLYSLTVIVQLRLLGTGDAGRRASYDHHRLWIRVALPLLISGAAYTVLERSDLLMIGLFLGPEEVAVYNASARTALLVSFVLTAIGSMAAPRFAALYAEGEMEKLQDLVLGVIRWSLIPSLALLAFLVVAGRPLLGLFGEAYTAGYPFLVMLAAAQSLAGLVGPAHHLLNVTGHEAITARGLVLVTLVNILLNASLIPHFGLWGAATATALSLSAWYILLPILAWRYVGIHSLAWARGRRDKDET